MSGQTVLTVGVGDIHGRFHRVQAWLEALEQARGRAIDAAFAVGDVEAFARADDHRRKAAKRAMPAEFSEYAAGTKRLHRPLYFIGGNNEDFEALHGMQTGGVLADGAEYLGRVGVRTVAGLKVAFLSGIYAPRFYEAPLELPRNQETSKQAGYFRKPEVERLLGERDVDVLLLHEWPRGLFRSQAREGSPAPRPWMGNVVSQRLVGALAPRWVLCGHSHLPWAASVRHPDRSVTRVACLDQAARPDAALFWVEWEGRTPVVAGWGTSGAPSWTAGEPWEADRVPAKAE